MKKGIESIGDHAFEGCTALTSVELPNGIKEIGSEAFIDCPLIVDITLPKGLRSVGDNVFEGTTYLDTLPEGLIYNGTCLLGYKGKLASNKNVCRKPMV